MQKLTDEQLCSMAQSGDTHARDLLVARYISFVGARAAAYAPVSITVDRDDYGQEGFIGLVSAIDSFDPSYGASFRTFAALNIDRRITDAVRSTLRKSRVPDSAKVADGSEIAAADNTEQTALMRDTLRRIFAELEMRTSPMERQALAMIMNGYTYGEAAKRLNCSAKAVENALTRVRRKLNHYK